MAIKIKGPVDSVKKLLGGGVDAMHGMGTRETKRKVAQNQRFNLRQRPVPSGKPPAEYGPAAYRAQQPQSGE